MLVDRQWNKHGTRLLHPSVTRGLRHPEEVEAENQEIAAKTWKDRLNNITQTALHDFVDIMAFLILGARILAAGGKFAMRQANFQQFVQTTPAVSILIMMGVAVLFFACAGRGGRVRRGQLSVVLAAGVEAGFPCARTDA